MKHSVILTSYNRQNMIRTAIQSVLEQSSGDFQLLIMDDGSEKATLDAIRATIGEDPRCRLFETGPLKEGETRRGICRMIDRINEGLKAADGELIHYLGDDDFYDPERFRIFDGLFQDPLVVVGYGILAFVDKEGRPTGDVIYRDVVDAPFCVLDHNQVAHRRRALDTLKGWEMLPPDHFSPDGHFFMRLAWNWKFHGVKRTVAYKRRHSFNMATTGDTSSARRE